MLALTGIAATFRLPVHMLINILTVTNANGSRWRQTVSRVHVCMVAPVNEIIGPCAASGCESTTPHCITQITVTGRIWNSF